MTLAEFYHDQLFNDCLPFWFPRSIDTEHGGFLHCFDGDGTLVDNDKSVWVQGRMSWMLLTLYLEYERRPEWLAWAENGLRFLEEKCIDPEDGRMFFHVMQDGTPVRKRRYAYSESFAAIAWAAHAAATGDRDSAEKARHWFDHFVNWNFTPGLMPPKFTGSRPMEAIGPRMIGLVTAQELIKHLGPDEALNGWIDRFLDDIRRLFVKPSLKVVMELVEPDGSISDHFDGRTLNPGHSIEAAWFILEEARRRDNDPELIRMACDMIDWMWERGWDTEYGGLFYFRDAHGKPVQEYWHDMKFWWPHDETLIATLMAHRMTGESRYLVMHEKCREWSFKHFGDPAHGEWYGYLRRDGVPTSTLKGSLWKSFFHHPRALWLCRQLSSE
ncbi:AGE family epimerase/isomerase [Luteolibacter ambystomatis]|uniref:AGE family epimerase/isomerase n=1 Tax=Luteolibacter ambystomatis TaxID=2824561 RepID=A0A975J054_9BACT|nr:AGE family epimerase/isomerase [Luteolibacter ambystomatis]QUE51577.1 AGE family epimerase/isomerase [Luteolibacter ambystomatis]